MTTKNTDEFNEGFEPKCLHVAVIGSPCEAALESWMREVTALLAYQPEIPLQHKVDLSNAMQAYRIASGRTPKPE